MGDSTMPFDNSEPTLEALAKFSTALFHVLEEAHGIPLLPLSDQIARPHN